MMRRRVKGPAGTLMVRVREGTGVPIVVLHGMVMEARAWSRLVAALDGGRAIVAPDLRGHGGSDRSADGDYSIAACADDLGAELDALALGTVVLVAHSYGASVAIEYAARHPDRVHALVLVDAAGDFSHVPAHALDGFLAGLDSDADYAATVDGAFEVALDGAGLVTERIVRPALLAAPPAMVRSMYRSLLAFRPTDRLDRYPGPVLLITTPVNAAAFALHALRPELPRREIVGTSHWVMLDRPADVAALIEAFLAGHP